MSWGKLDDGFHRHLKVQRCSMAARGLWTTAFSWTADNELDGFIPEEMLAKLAETTDYAPLVAELTRVQAPFTHGLWEACDGGYGMHDYLTINPSRAMLDKARKLHAKAAAKWRRKRDRSRSNHSSVTRRSPPTGRDGTGTPPVSSSSKSWRTVPEGELLTPKRRADAEALGMPPDGVEAEWADFADHEFFRPKVSVDKTWRRWVREAAKRASVTAPSRPRVVSGSKTAGNVAAARAFAARTGEHR